jgi:ectoine hydroxylase-related dioxygenase (phytanoyl-CoA dioxygenase family)
VERAPHPWNRGFAWPEHRNVNTISAEQARAYDEVGYFVIEDAFSAEEMEQLDAALTHGDEKAKEMLASVPGGRFSVAGLDTQTVAPHAVTRSDHARRFAAHPLFAGVARDLIGPDVRLYWDQSVYKQPNSAEPVLWHQDNGYTYVEPQSYLTCWVAITDATPENGCVSVMPGVHHDGTLVHHTTPVGQECWGDWNTAVEVPVRAGSVVVFTSLTPHATKRNTTDAVRKAYILQYAPDGAVALRGEPAGGPPVARDAQDDERRQFWIVRDGEPVSEQSKSS